MDPPKIHWAPSLHQALWTLAHITHSIHNHPQHKHWGQHLCSLLYRCAHWDLSHGSWEAEVEFKTRPSVFFPNTSFPNILLQDINLSFMPVIEQSFFRNSHHNISVSTFSTRSFLSPHQWEESISCPSKPGSALATVDKQNAEKPGLCDFCG